MGTCNSTTPQRVVCARRSSFTPSGRHESGSDLRFWVVELVTDRRGTAPRHAPATVRRLLCSGLRIRSEVLRGPDRPQLEPACGQSATRSGSRSCAARPVVAPARFRHRPRFSAAPVASCLSRGDLPRRCPPPARRGRWWRVARQSPRPCPGRSRRLGFTGAAGCSARALSAARGVPHRFIEGRAHGVRLHRCTGSELHADRQSTAPGTRVVTAAGRDRELAWACASLRSRGPASREVEFP